MALGSKYIYSMVSSLSPLFTVTPTDCQLWCSILVCQSLLLSFQRPDAVGSERGETGKKSQHCHMHRPKSIMCLGSFSLNVKALWLIFSSGLVVAACGVSRLRFD